MTIGLRRGVFVGVVCCAFAVAAPQAHAFDAFFQTASADGSAVVFATGDKLLPADTDSNSDFYVHRNPGGLDLVTTGPAGGNASFSSQIFGAVSADGQRVIFETNEQLTADDTDGSRDVYERSAAGTTTLVSAAAANGGAEMRFRGATPSATTVYFETSGSLVAADAADVDVYSRSGGVTALVSDGTDGGDANDDGAFFEGVAEDGSRVFFRSKEPLAGEAADSCGSTLDPGGCLDIFERGAVALTHSTPGSLTDPEFEATNATGTRMWFTTSGSLVAGDTDAGRTDVYHRSGGATSLISGVSGAPSSVGFAGAPKTGSDATAFFTTAEQLSGSDTDTQTDIYSGNGASPILVSTGLAGGNGALGAFFGATDRDGVSVFFVTGERLTADDTDASVDIYQRVPFQNGTWRHTVGEGGAGNGPSTVHFGGISSNGASTFFSTDESLVAADGDNLFDAYRYDGGITLLSAGPPGTGGFYAANSADGTRALFTTSTSLAAGDGDASQDIYERTGTTTTLRSPDQRPPETTAILGPDLTRDPTPLFNLTSDEPDATFLCKVDDAAFADCQSAHTPAPLTDGQHTIYARARDPSGNTDDGFVSHEFTVDTVAPAVPVLSGTSPPSPADDEAPELLGSAGAGDPTHVRIYRSEDCSGFGQQLDPSNLVAGITQPVGPDSVTAFSATALDGAGNESSCSDSIAYIEDSTVPVAPVIGGTQPAGPSTDDRPEVSGAAEPGSSVRVYSTADCTGTPLAVGQAAAFAAPGLTVAVAPNTTTQLRAAATDAAGHVSPCSEPRAYTEESVAPNTQIDLVKLAHRKRSATAAFHGDDPAPGTSPLTFQCRLDARPWSSCRTPKTFKRLKVGRHTMRIRATDAAGNTETSPASRRFRIRRVRRRG